MRILLCVLFIQVLIIMFFVFIGANFPWFLLVSLDFNDQAHHGFYYVTVWLVHTATTLNPVIYAAKYPQFQKCFKKFVNRLFCNQLFETRVNSVAALHKNMSQFHHNNNQNNNNNIGNNNHDNINNIGNNKHDINNIGNNNDDNDIANRDRSNININNSNDKINNITSHDDNEAKQNNLSSARKTRGRKLSRQSQHESYEQWKWQQLRVLSWSHHAAKHTLSDFSGQPSQLAWSRYLDFHQLVKLQLEINFSQFFTIFIDKC